MPVVWGPLGRKVLRSRRVSRGGVVPIGGASSLMGRRLRNHCFL